MMQLLLEINKYTKKKNWCKDKCDACSYRFSCFSGDDIVIEPDKLGNNDGYFVVSFLVPHCLRIGLFKQLGSGFYGMYHDSAYGKLIDTDYRLDIHHVTVSLHPPTIKIVGRMY
jgi:hypothetical protein